MRNNIEIAYNQIQVNVEVDSNLMKQNIETIASSRKYLSSMIGRLKDQIDIHIEKTKNEMLAIDLAMADKTKTADSRSKGERQLNHRFLTTLLVLLHQPENSGY